MNPNATSVQDTYSPWENKMSSVRIVFERGFSCSCCLVAYLNVQIILIFLITRRLGSIDIKSQSSRPKSMTQTLWRGSHQQSDLPMHHDMAVLHASKWNLSAALDALWCGNYLYSLLFQVEGWRKGFLCMSLEPLSSEHMMSICAPEVHQMCLFFELAALHDQCNSRSLC